MKFFLCLSVCALASLTGRGRAVPTSPVLAADALAERESRDSNEVGPPDDWTLWRRLSKTAAFVPTDSEERSRAVAKEIAELMRLAQSYNGTAGDGGDPTAAAVTDGDAVADDDAVTDADAEAASSDWIGRGRAVDAAVAPSLLLSDRQDAAVDEDDGNFEDIVRKISNDLKKLYVKVKQVMTVVKNWINTVRGHRSETDGPYTMSGSPSESDGVFVIADPLIGDVDKSNKYTVPIHAD